MISTDEQAWLKAPNHHKWVFNKLEVAMRSNILCGPREIPVPKEGEYIIRPIYNLSGMGLGAKKVHLKPSNQENFIPLGFFWSEILEGQHLSVDYKATQPILAVEGTYSELNYWEKWKRVDVSSAPPIPAFFENVSVYYPVVNVEYIGGVAIELHLRGNPDFKGLKKVKTLIPVWSNTPKAYINDLKKEGYKFKADREESLANNRLGFLYK